MMPMQELDALITAGWGDTPRRKIPPNWRDLKPPPTQGPKTSSRRKHHADAMRAWRASSPWGRPGAANASKKGARA
jgi:hypothetical protein